MPDSVSMSISQAGPLVEGTSYRLLCDILNVAPVGILSVRWHKGSKVFHTETFNKSTVRPDNRSSSVRLLAERDDNGTMIWCEAKLNFGPTGPDIIPTKSQPHEVIVLCKFLIAYRLNWTMADSVRCALSFSTPVWMSVFSHFILMLRSPDLRSSWTGGARTSSWWYSNVKLQCSRKPSACVQLELISDAEQDQRSDSTLVPGCWVSRDLQLHSNQLTGHQDQIFQGHRP